MHPALFKTRWKKSDAAWLLLAVTVHAFLLLIPLQHRVYQPAAETVLNISLLPYVDTTAESKPSTIADSARSPPDAAASSAAAPRVQATQPDKTNPSVTPKNEAGEKPVLVIRTTAQLLETVRTSLLDRSQASTSRQLGIHVPQELPANWRPGTGSRALQPTNNLFNGMVKPSEIEIVDRWLAADGSHNVVMNLPDGKTMCGRAEPWSPLQPLVEHLMMWRDCGGGGKRTFSMAARLPTRAASSWENSID